MDQITHDVRRQNWLNIINACQNRPEDVSAHRWLTDNGIKEKAYYYWIRKFRNEAAEADKLPTVSIPNEVSFAEMPFGRIRSITEDNPKEAATIRKNGMTIEISNSISGQLLSLLLQEVSRV